MAISDLLKPVTAKNAARGAVAACVTWAIALIATSAMLPMGWDEGDAILRAQQIPGSWPYTTVREGHPALPGVMLAAGHVLAGRWFEPLTAWRLGPMLLFAVAAGAMYYRLARDVSAVAGLVGAAALLLMPRVFAHAHFALGDSALTACWVLAWVAFGPAGPGSKLAAAGWGIPLGMAMSCKASGWLAPVAFILWSVIYRPRGRLSRLGLGLGVALVTFYALNPPLWAQPIAGTCEFLRLNFSRHEAGLNLTAQFFGRLYNLDHPLPWYNTLVWTAMTVPVGLLGLAILGLVDAAAGARRRPAGMLLVLHWLTLVVARAVPGVPQHDAERLFLPAFAMLAALAGIGAHRLLSSSPRTSWRTSWGLLRFFGHRAGTTTKERSAGVGKNGIVPVKGEAPRTVRWPVAAVAAILLGSATSLFWYAPQWLSYYNLLIGGLRGAVAMGMEPTYYWDALDAEVLRWLNEHTPPDEAIYFAGGSPDNLALLTRWGRLERAVTTSVGNDRWRWYVLQRRGSGMQPVDHWLAEHATPAFTKAIRRAGWGPWRLDVPLIEVYSRTQYLEAVAARGSKGTRIKGDVTDSFRSLPGNTRSNAS
ncbi:MAG: ArnT family glycosyltransferase [Planctomycetota bacterium]